MDAEQLVAEGLVLMLVGMGTVFVFLTALVLTTHVMSKLLARYPESVASLETIAQRPQAGVAAGDPNLIAVIGAAIHRHRRSTAARRRDDSD